MGETEADIERGPEENHMIMMRILGPIINFVNRPWKVRISLSILWVSLSLRYKIDVSCRRSLWAW